MEISQSWLTTQLRKATPDWQVSAADLDTGFVRVGFETEGYEAIPDTTGPLVFGRVEQIEELTEFKKPIRYCQVNVGSANGTGELQGIICGARNFREGDTVIVALPGTVLPGNFAIGARETYGKISAGMICSAQELGLAAKSAGILTVDPSAGELGSDAREFLGLEDTVFDVNITPDRGYALSVRGLTRELASSFDLSFSDPLDEIAEVAVEGENLPVQIDPATKTVRFGLRSVTGVNPEATTPYWMERELLLSGQRLVNVPTDITNYIMLLLGQPMHAFDGGALSGGLTVRNAVAGEQFDTLDHVTRTLDATDVVICDEERIQSLAGVMGGTTSEIADDTTEVIFEAATWDPLTVARTARRHRLSSEASRRFERGVDAALVERALDLAVTLLVEIAGGEIAPGRTLIGEVPVMPSITMAEARPSQVAGVEYPAGTTQARLEEVGCAVTALDEELLQITPPSWRGDLTMPADLVEEVLRLEGLESIPSVLPAAPAGRGLTPAQRRRRGVGRALALGGYVEVIPTPFMANDLCDRWGLAADDPRRMTVAVQNPLEADNATLAPTLLPAMCDALRRNVTRGQVDVSLFGIAQVTQATAVSGTSPMPDVTARPSDEEIAALLDSLPAQPLHVATVSAGLREPAGPWGTGRKADFWDALEAAKQVARSADVEVSFARAEQLPWHPGRCAAVSVGDTVVGYAGELHPKVCAEMNLPERTVAMELNLSALPLDPSRPSPQLSPFPALLQDIAVVVDTDTPAESVRVALREGAGELLEDIALFDVFTGEQLGEGKKSLAFSLRFRAPDRTLTDDELVPAREAAIAVAAERTGAVLR